MHLRRKQTAKKHGNKKAMAMAIRKQYKSKQTTRNIRYPDIHRYGDTQISNTATGRFDAEINR